MSGWSWVQFSVWPSFLFNRGTMQILQDMLYCHHPGVQLDKQAFDLTRNITANQYCRIALRFTDEQDCQCYNLPTTTELAVILPGDGDQPTNSRDIVLFRTGGGLQRINDLHPFYPALHYVTTCEQKEDKPPVLMFGSGQVCL